MQDFTYTSSRIANHNDKKYGSLDDFCYENRLRTKNDITQKKRLLYHLDNKSSRLPDVSTILFPIDDMISFANELDLKPIETENQNQTEETKPKPKTETENQSHVLISEFAKVTERLKELEAENKDYIIRLNQTNRAKKDLETENQNQKTELENQKTKLEAQNQKIEELAFKAKQLIDEQAYKIEALKPINNAYEKLKTQIETEKQTKNQSDLRLLFIAQVITAVITGAVAFKEFLQFTGGDIPITIGFAIVFCISLLTVNYYLPWTNWYDKIFKVIVILFFSAVEFSSVALFFKVFEKKYSNNLQFGFDILLTLALPIANLIISITLTKRLRN